MCEFIVVGHEWARISVGKQPSFVNSAATAQDLILGLWLYQADCVDVLVYVQNVNHVFLSFSDQAPFDPNAKADKFYINVEVGLKYRSFRSYVSPSKY